MDQSHLTKTYCTGEYDRSNRKQRLHQLDQALAESEEKYFANGATASATLTRQRTPSFAIQSLGRQPQLLHQDLMPDNLGALRRTWSHHQTRSSFSEPHSVVMAQPLLDQPTATATATTATATATATVNETERQRLLIVSFLILFTRYVIATFLSAFFPQVSVQQNISGTWEGIIFAAYPIGMAITSTIAPTFILKWGTRTSIMVGLLFSGISTVLFGAVPDAVQWMYHGDHRTTAALQYSYAIAYFLNGLLGGLADTGVLILISAKFKDKLGVVFATVGTVCGVGCMLGPLFGAAFYTMAQNTTWQFRAPFLITSMVPFVLCAVSPCVVPQVYGGEGDQGSQKNPGSQGSEGHNEHRPKGCQAALKALRTPSVFLSVCAIALSGTIVATLDPTLAFRLSSSATNNSSRSVNRSQSTPNNASYPAWVDGHPAPFDLSEAEVAFFFTYSSIVYVLVSMPIGWVVDKYQNNASVFKLIQAFGFVLLALCFALLGPLRLPSVFNGIGLEHALNSMGCAVVALVLKGLGSATNNAAYPDMMIGIDENDDVLNAALSGIWNAAYSIGWAFGPLLGGFLYEWLAFDGFATVVAAGSLCYALVLVVAVLCCKDKRKGVKRLECRGGVGK